MKILESFLQTKDKKYLKFLLSLVWLRLYKYFLGRNYSVTLDAIPFTKKTFNRLLKLIPSFSKPYFIFINLMQIHGKYNPPAPFRGSLVAP